MDGYNRPVPFLLFGPPGKQMVALEKTIISHDFQLFV